MKWHMLFATLAAVLILLGLNGCNGSAPGLKPTVSLSTNPQDAAYMVSGGTVAILGTTYPGTPTGTTLTDQITSTSWTQSPASPAGMFQIVSENNVASNSLTNAWTAPVVQAPTKFTLTLQMKTQLNAVSSASIVVTVVPTLPAYNFAATPASVMSGAVVSIVGSANLPISIWQWTATSSASGSTGSFDNTSSSNPHWTAPTLMYGATPIEVTLSVQMMTATGIPGTSTLTIMVNPPLD